MKALIQLRHVLIVDLSSPLAAFFLPIFKNSPSRNNRKLEIIIYFSRSKVYKND